MVDPLFGTRLYRAMRDSYVPASMPVVRETQAAVVVQISPAARERMAAEHNAQDAGAPDVEPDAPLYFNRRRAKARQG
jgi:hypothetical protein